jgi:hypothetical protein
MGVRGDSPRPGHVRCAGRRSCELLNFSLVGRGYWTSVSLDAPPAGTAGPTRDSDAEFNPATMPDGRWDLRRAGYTPGTQCRIATSPTGSRRKGGSHGDVFARPVYNRNEKNHDVGGRSAARGRQRRDGSDLDALVRAKWLHRVIYCGCGLCPCVRSFCRS